MIDFPASTSLSSELISDLSSLQKSWAATFCCVSLPPRLCAGPGAQLKYLDAVGHSLTVVVRHERTLAEFDLHLA